MLLGVTREPCALSAPRTQNEDHCSFRDMRIATLISGWLPKVLKSVQAGPPKTMLRARLHDPVHRSARVWSFETLRQSWAGGGFRKQGPLRRDLEPGRLNRCPRARPARGQSPSMMVRRWCLQTGERSSASYHHCQCRPEWYRQQPGNGHRLEARSALGSGHWPRSEGPE
jgi:hypothetical protein